MSNITLQANEIQSVSFHNQSIAVLSCKDKPYIAMKPIVENIGLDWVSQLKRIKRHPILNRGMVIMTIVAKDGKNRELACIPLSMLNGWLFGIDVNRVKPELKDRLIQYQEECFEVLFNHFMPKINNGLLPSHQRHIQNVVSKLANVAGNSYQAVYRSIKDRFQVGTYKDIPEEKYHALCEFLGCEPLEGEYIAFSNNKSNLSDDEWYDLAWLFKAAYHMRDKLEDLSPSLNAIRSDYATSVSSMAHEYKRNLESAKVILIRETAHIEPYSFKWQTVLPELRNKF